jgi:hypothetical protein
MRWNAANWVDRAMLLVAAVLLVPILTIAALPFLPVVLLAWPLLAFAAV